MSTQEERDKLVARLRKMGVLAMEDVTSIEDANSVLDSIEKFEIDWPAELLAMTVQHCKKHRNEIWTLSEPLQRLFWDMQMMAAHELYHMQMSKEGIEEFLDRAYDGRKFIEIANKWFKK